MIAFLADNADDIALYGGALRSPFFGLSDADIFRAAGGRGGRGGLFSRLSEDATGPVADACRMLARWQAYARREPPSVLVSRIIRESGMYAVCAGQKNGDQKTANLRKITEIARSVRPGGMLWVRCLCSGSQAGATGRTERGGRTPADRRGGGCGAGDDRPCLKGGVGVPRCRPALHQRGQRRPQERKCV